MTGPERTLRDEIAAVVEERWRHEIADALLPVAQARIDAARAEVAEAIAQAISKRRDVHWHDPDRKRLPGDKSEPYDYGVHDALNWATDIARQHAATAGPRP